MVDGTREPLVRIKGVSKSYAGVCALDRVDLEIRPGEIHALCGENGAGKSTLIKILAGTIMPDGGRVLIGGKPLPPGSIRHAENAGIAVIHQEVAGFPHLNAQDNIFAGREPRQFGFLLDRKRMLAQTRALLARLGETIDPRTPVGELPLAQRQLIAMARALSGRCRLLIMDEPTASLSVREAESLFRIVRQLKSEGVSVLYVSHRLEEIFSLCDRVTVLRDGKFVATRDLSGGEISLSRADLIKLMVGRELLQVEGIVQQHAEAQGSGKILEAANLGRNGVFSGINFSIHRGEIVGMAGLVGAGRSEIARAIFGVDALDEGTIKIDEQPLPGGSVQGAMQSGIALVPEDRQHLGLILPMSLASNLSMAVFPSLTRLGLISAARQENLCTNFMRDLHIKAAGTHVAAQTLSGGNQQKLVVGKWLATRPKVLILDEPTRGVDVGAKAEIYRLIRQLASDGLAILLISSDLPEILLLSDRILVIRAGHLSGELHREQATQEKILQFAMPDGGTANEHAAQAASQTQKKSAASPLRRTPFQREAGLAVLLALITAIVSLRNPAFFSLDNLSDILIKCTQPAIVACGVMLVILTGEIDISVGSLLGLLTAALGLMVSPTRLGWPVPVGILAILGLGTFAGLLNGLLVTLIGIPSIIVTLGMLTLLRGITIILLKPRGDITDIPDSVRFLGIGHALGISVSIWIAAITVATTFALLRWTALGRRIFAVGSSPHAAALSGLSATRIKIFAFTFTGFLVALATLVTQLATVNTGIGDGFELLVVTCVVVGGVSINGGVGTVAGVMLGVLLLQLQSTALIFMNLGNGTAFWNKAIQGALILAAVLLDHLTSRWRSGRQVSR